MGPKIKFTKEQIIDATFEIAKGIDNLTVKKSRKKSKRKIFDRLQNILKPYMRGKDVFK